MAPGQAVARTSETRRVVPVVESARNCDPAELYASVHFPLIREAAADYIAEVLASVRPAGQATG